MQVNARLFVKKPTELVEGQWTAAAAGKLEPNMTRRSSLRAIPQNSAKRCKRTTICFVTGCGDDTISVVCGDGADDTEEKGHTSRETSPTSQRREEAALRSVRDLIR